MVKISVIVPVYNVEPYLPQCLDSLIEQTFNDIEIICVNDGSTDGSLDVLNHYAAKDSRIKVIDKPNGGVSSARNCGLDAAQGEYVSFVDGDDWLKRNAYEEIISAVDKRNVDMAVFGYYEYLDGNLTETGAKKVLKRFEEEKIPFEKLVLYFCNSICDKIYRRDFLQKNHLRFHEHLIIAEDGFFNLQCVFKQPAIQAIGQSYYCYRLFRQGSTMSRAISLDEVEKQFEFYHKSDFFQKLNTEEKCLVDLKNLGGLLYRYRLLPAELQPSNRQYLKKCKIYLNKHYAKSKLKKNASYRSLCKEIDFWGYRKKIENMIQGIFSVKNSKDKKQKIVTVFGKKIYINR